MQPPLTRRSSWLTAMPGSMFMSSVDHNANFRIVAEVIESGWVWIVILVCLIAWAAVAGLEQRRRRPPPPMSGKLLRPPSALTVTADQRVGGGVMA